MPLNDALSIPKRLKGWSNRSGDRIFERSGSIVLDHTMIRPGWLRTAVYSGARTVARACAMWRDLPQMSAYDLAGAAWRLRVVGDASQAAHVAHVFFPGEEPEFAEVGGGAPSSAGAGAAMAGDGVDLCWPEAFPGHWREMRRSILSCPIRWSNIWCSIRPWSKWWPAGGAVAFGHD